MPYVPRSLRAGSLVGSLLVALTLAGCGSATPAAAPTSVPAAAAPTTPPASEPTVVPTAASTSAPTTEPTVAAASEPTVAATTDTTSAPTIATGATASPLDAAALQAVGDVVAKYMFATPATSFALVVDGVSGDIARITAVPPDFDQTTIFLKNGANGWEILSAGTTFSPEDLAELKVPQALAEQPADFEEHAAALNAATTYLSQQEKLTKFYTIADASEGDYARVRSISLETDPAYVFLKREGGAWKVLTYGTAFGPDDYQSLGIPASLQVP